MIFSDFGVAADGGGPKARNEDGSRASVTTEVTQNDTPRASATIITPVNTMPSRAEQDAAEEIGRSALIANDWNAELYEGSKVPPPTIDLSTVGPEPTDSPVATLWDPNFYKDPTAYMKSQPTGFKDPVPLSAFAGLGDPTYDPYATGIPDVMQMIDNVTGEMVSVATTAPPASKGTPPIVWLGVAYFLFKVLG